MEIEDKTRKETKRICRITSLHTVTQIIKIILQQEGSNAANVK